jgi:hypothetical protein
MLHPIEHVAGRQCLTDIFVHHHSEERIAYLEADILAGFVADH